MHIYHTTVTADDKLSFIITLTVKIILVIYTFVTGELWSKGTTFCEHKTIDYTKCKT